MISVDSLTPKTWIKTPNSSLQDRSRWSYIGHKDEVAILDAMLNYTFLPHIWNVYPSFFQSPMGPLQGSRVKIRGHIIAHRTPPQPQDYMHMRRVELTDVDRTVSHLFITCRHRSWTAKHVIKVASFLPLLATSFCFQDDGITFYRKRDISNVWKSRDFQQKNLVQIGNYLSRTMLFNIAEGCWNHIIMQYRAALFPITLTGRCRPLRWFIL